MERITRERGSRSLLAIYGDLGKIRLTGLVVITVLVGFVVPVADDLLPAPLFWTLVGVTLTACGVNAVNQWMERVQDRRMRRTRMRPLPAGEIGARHALLAGCAAAAAGPLIIWWQTCGIAALLTLMTALIYLFVYTPLKSKNSLCTLVGAVVGALPPIIGWAAATGGISFGALVLGSLLFVWQIPHFLSLAWLHREDYARGGFRMLPVVEPSGRTTFRMVVLYSLALMPVAFTAVFAGIAGWTYGIGSLLLGAAMLFLGLRFHRCHTDLSARRLFFASIIYLPILLGLMVFDRGPVSFPGSIASAAEGLQSPSGGDRAVLKMAR